MIRLKIKNVSVYKDAKDNEVPNTHLLVLEEVGKKKRILPIHISDLDTQNLLLAHNNQYFSRPLPHHIFHQAMRHFGARLRHVLIEDADKGVFFATLVIDTGEEELTLDSRPSDALIYAIVKNRPVYASEKVMRKMSIPQYDHELVLLSKMDLEDLEHKKSIAIEQEDFALAATLRDLIKQRKSQA